MPMPGISFVLHLIPTFDHHLFPDGTPRCLSPSSSARPNGVFSLPKLFFIAAKGLTLSTAPMRVALCSSSNMLEPQRSFVAFKFSIPRGWAKLRHQGRPHLGANLGDLHGEDSSMLSHHDLDIGKWPLGIIGLNADYPDRRFLRAADL